jgi:hypothetical protein
MSSDHAALKKMIRNSYGGWLADVLDVRTAWQFMHRLFFHAATGFMASFSLGASQRRGRRRTMLRCNYSS